MTAKRIGLGLAAAVACGLIAGELISRVHLSIDPVVQSVIQSLIGTAVGAFIARRGFVFPALGLWLLEWLVIVWYLYRIAVPTGQASLPNILQLNLIGMTVSALAVVAGALLGQAFAGRKQRFSRTG